MGKMWLEYNKEKYPRKITTLIMTGKLDFKVREMDERMEKEKEAIIQALLKVKPMPDTADTLEETAHMNQLYQQATEMILKNYLT